MRLTDAIKIAQTLLPEKRMRHVLGVAETSQRLARKYKVDIEKAGVAAVLHDIAKYKSIDEMSDILNATPGFEHYLSANVEVWHAPVGAILAQKQFGISDEDVLNAIQFHTTGRENMSMLEKIVFVADFIEPGRTHEVCKQCAELAEVSLEAAVAFECKCTIEFLQGKNENIHEDTLRAFEFYTTSSS